jgi:hypothetical protein
MILKRAERQVKEDERRDEDDPVLLMLGVGKQLWESESGDRFIERLRSEELTDSPASGRHEAAAQNLPETVWQRIKSHQGEEFRTVTGLPLTYEVEGAGIWFWRDGERKNRKLTRNQVNVAISRCPLRATTEIKDLIDYPYLFAVLMDRRIRGDAW